MENTVNERVAKLLAHWETNANAFAESIGVKNPMIYNLIGGRKSEPSFGLLQKILSFDRSINPDWLIHGEGEMFRSKKDIVFSQSGNILYVEEEQVRAGLFQGYSNNILTKDQLPRVFIPGFENGELYMFPVKGDSMKPFITNGDLLIAAEIKDLNQITSGHAYVFAHANEGIVVKRLYKTNQKLTFEARSDNSDYPPFEITFADNSHIYIVKGVLTANTSKR